jgi:hypothetical protein
MGMFDTIWVACPECDIEMGLQTKSGECVLNHYPAYKVPFSVATDLLNPYYYAKDVNGYIECENCHAKLYITASPTLASQHVVVQLHKMTDMAKIEREQYE